MNIVVLRRRLFYICAIVVLLIPLYFLGNPSVRNQDGSVKQPGGTLAQIRTAYDLGQGDLGEIDPASESMRLATLGLRGVAATILWQKAEYYKKEQFWDRLSATLNQIAVLQPHFVEVWEFQSHNLSYNVSAEFDDYRQRYQWVKRGIDYLIKGSKFNKRRTEMPFELGFFFGSKMGVADEKKQFRALYREDENFHAEVLEKTGLDLRQPEGLGPDRKPDNWLSGRLWYNRAYDMVESGANPARSAMMFYLKGPQWLMKHAEAMQEEGTLDEAARYAWRVAGREWADFGERQIVTTFGDTIYLSELERARTEYDKQKRQFEEFCGESYTKLRDQRMKVLTDEELKAWEKPHYDRNFEEMLQAEHVQSVLEIPPLEIARATPEDKRVKALQDAKLLDLQREKISHIEIYRNQINFAYWTQRCLAEQEDDAILARTSMYEANLLLDRGELDAALEKYELAWSAWASLFNKFPAMMIDDAADEVIASIERYRRLLDQADLPTDFALQPFMEFRQIYEDDLADAALMSLISSWPASYPDRDFLSEMLRKSKSNDLASDLQSVLEVAPSDAAPIDVTAPEEGSPPVPQKTEPKAESSENKDTNPTVASQIPPAREPQQVEDDAVEEVEDRKDQEEKADAAEPNLESSKPVTVAPEAGPAINSPEVGAPPSPKSSR